MYAGAMHEMPMTTAPMRPTVPALRPFVDRPVAAPFSPTGASGAAAPMSIAHRDSPSEARVRGTTIIGNGKFVEHLRCGRTEEQTARLGETARADDRELARLPAEVLDRVFDAVAATHDDFGVAHARDAGTRLGEHLIGVGGAGDRITPVSTVGGRSTVTSDSSRSSAPVAPASDVASSRSASAPGRVPIAAVMRVTPVEGSIRRDPSGASTTGTSDECSSSVATEPSRWRPRRPPLAAPTTMCDAPDSSAAATRPSANESANRTLVRCATRVGDVRGGRFQPGVGLAPQIAVVARVGGRDHAAVVRGQDDDHLEFGTGCRGQARTEGDGILSRIGGGVADDDVSAHARASSRICEATRRPMRIAPSTCW